MKDKQTTQKTARTLRGVVVSDRMHKTIVVRVERRKKHPRYHKFITRTRRFKAHDAQSRYRTGEEVIIRESRPLSREKRWVVIERVGKGTVAPREEKGEVQTSAQL